MYNVFFLYGDQTITDLLKSGKGGKLSREIQFEF